MGKIDQIVGLFRSAVTIVKDFVKAAPSPESIVFAPQHNWTMVTSARNGTSFYLDLRNIAEGDWQLIVECLEKMGFAEGKDFEIRDSNVFSGRKSPPTRVLAILGVVASAKFDNRMSRHSKLAQSGKYPSQG